MKVLLLDSVRSLQNIGAMFRSADAAGFDKIYLTGTCAVPPRKIISKTALGAENTIDWEYYNNPLVLIDHLKSLGVTIVSIELTDQSQDFRLLTKYSDKDICLVLGNEVNGVEKSIIEKSDIIAQIPMLGHKASLNVSVAAGIAMYTLVPLPL